MKEISTLQLVESLPSALEENDVPVQLDLWWGKIFQTSSYPVLSQVFKACLSIFSGPHVESSFSLMSNIIDKWSNRMNIDTYNAMMTIKYSLQSKSSSEIYRRPDVLYDLIDKKICYYVRTSHSRYKKRMHKNQLEKKKGAVSRGVKVWTCIFKTRTKTKTIKKPTDYTSNITNFCLQWQYIDWIFLLNIHNTEFTHSTFMIYLLYFLILQFKIFSAFLSSVICYNYLRPFTQHFKRKLSWPLLVW